MEDEFNEYSRTIKRGLGLIHRVKEVNALVPGGQLGRMATMSETTSAFTVLTRILTSGVIRSSGQNGNVKPPTRAVCLSETPLSQLGRLTPSIYGLMQGDRSHQVYGILMNRADVFALGGRPVIYLPHAEFRWIPQQEQWRHVRFEGPELDLTAEREWRVPGDLSLDALAGYYVVVWSLEQAQAIRDLDFGTKSLVRGVLPMEELGSML